MCEREIEAERGREKTERENIYSFYFVFSLVVDTSPAKAVVSSDNDVIHEHESFTTYASFKKRCSTKVWTEKGRITLRL